MLLSRTSNLFLRGVQSFARFSTVVPGAANHALFESPTVTYTPFAPGGTIDGHVAPGWEGMQDAFAENFAEGAEKGAQLVIIVDGETVVDLYGASPSCTTSKSPYDGDTMQNIFSSGKQIEALVMAMLADRGQVEYSDLVTKHWPEFGQGGKDKITIADVMRHSGGVPWFNKPEVLQPGESGEGHEESSFNIYGLEGLNDPLAMDKVVETSPRVECDGSVRTYHGQTRGLLVDGILRRVDPKGRDIATFVAEEICAPLGVTHYRPSVPVAEQEQFNWADIGPPQSTFALNMQIGPAMMGFGRPDVNQMMKLMTPGNPMMVSAGGFDVMKNHETGIMDGAMVNKPELRASVMTSALTSSTARAQAAIYRNFAEGGGKLLSSDGVARALEDPITLPDGCLKNPSTFTQGGMARIADSAKNDFPAMAESMKGLFGWCGWGGSMSLMDPERKVTYMYCMSGMDVGLLGDPRTHRLTQAYQDCMKKNE